MNIVNSNWLDILKCEVAKTSKSAVGNRIGYSRTAVHLALEGQYKGNTRHIEAAVFKHLVNGVFCPHLASTITETECADYSTRSIPQSNASHLRHWRTCQACPLSQANHEFTKEAPIR